jgi:hypothetical protein
LKFVPTSQVQPKILNQYHFYTELRKARQKNSELFGNIMDCSQFQNVEANISGSFENFTTGTLFGFSYTRRGTDKLMNILLAKLLRIFPLSST